MIKKILNTDPEKRFTIADIKSHEWYNRVKLPLLEGIIVGKEKIPVINEAL